MVNQEIDLKEKISGLQTSNNDYSAPKGLTNILKICPVCGKAFHPSRKEYKTCSWQCGARIRKGKTAYNRITISCDYCGKSFSISQARYKRYQHHYCSTACYYLAKKENMKGKKNPNYKNGPIAKICPSCGKEFYTYSKNQKHCSYKCSRQFNLLKKGRKFEWKARKELELQGYTVMRSAGSKGAFDLIAFNESSIRLIQIKSTNNLKSSLEALFRDDLKRVKGCPAPPDATKELWCWRARKGWEKLKVV